ncbi:MAG: NDP-sugar synthase [Proteobacteria bacterium]|nr:NDP-sugar synthase [Pseudomonadota bacterium]MBU1738610.1 NDP-sugar synthase [Pseudomonadota bacterium]
MQAMILAAGLGTRLKPYTGHRPKPLFPVLGKPLIVYLLEQLHRQDFSRVVVNAHHLREQFVSLLGHVPGVFLQLEEEILGTGGGLRKAQPKFNDGPVLIVNGDILHSYDLSRIVQSHNESGCPVSLVVHDYPRFNNVVVSGDGFVRGFRAAVQNPPESGQRILAFTGIHVIDPGILKSIPQDSFYDVIDLYRELSASGKNEIAAIEMKDGFWTDIGTPLDYLNLHRDLLAGKAPSFLQETIGPFSGPKMIMPDVSIGRDVVFEDWVCIGTGARIGDGVHIARSVIWDGAVIEKGTFLEDAIVVG